MTAIWACRYNKKEKMGEKKGKKEQEIDKEKKGEANKT